MIIAIYFAKASLGTAVSWHTQILTIDGQTKYYNLGSQLLFVDEIMKDDWKKR
jgi:hypothetical protein